MDGGGDGGMREYRQETQEFNPQLDKSKSTITTQNPRLESKKILKKMKNKWRQKVWIFLNKKIDFF